MRKAKAALTLTWPAGMGRSRVRSTRPSKLRSAMSFSVQPAPRMMMAPMRKSRAYHGLGRPPPRRSGPAPGPTSREAAAATSRSAARAASAAHRGGRPCGSRRSAQWSGRASATRLAAGLLASVMGAVYIRSPMKTTPRLHLDAGARSPPRDRAAARAGALPDGCAAARAGRPRLGVQCARRGVAVPSHRPSPRRARACAWSVWPLP